MYTVERYVDSGNELGRKLKAEDVQYCEAVLWDVFVGREVKHEKLYNCRKKEIKKYSFLSQLPRCAEVNGAWSHE